MISTTRSFTLDGANAKPIIIECDMTNGLPSVSIVGMPSSSAESCRQRVRSAITNSGFNFPRKHITINLAPTGEALASSLYDLPIALAILIHSKQLSRTLLENYYAVGELGLDGSLRPVRGVIGMLQYAKLRKNSLIIPLANQKQTNLLPGLMVTAANSLRELINILVGSAPGPTLGHQVDIPQATPDIDFSEVIDQPTAKRALEIAAAGQHNVLLTGPPGTGKSMLAKALPGILPPMHLQELLEVSQLHSLVSNDFQHIQTVRPFRAPHHSASHIALVGGGPTSKPGEISLSHAGVLLLDEAPEFSKQSLEALRQPMEDGQIRISRANRSTTYPARFILVATMNPCPCGYYGDRTKACTCTITEVTNYQKKLSGPIMDRIDMSIAVNRLDPKRITGQISQNETSSEIQKRVVVARDRQYARLGDGRTNSTLTSRYIRQSGALEPEARVLLLSAVEKLDLSPRSYFRICRVAQTIADLEASERIQAQHMAEALRYRIVDSRFMATSNLTPEA